ncbi:hypothetical protein K1719_002250 [Acacia pycnantha]|nr:hypothetical protein K1719_002250 [Acacia pycnantha]
MTKETKEVSPPISDEGLRSTKKVRLCSGEIVEGVDSSVLGSDADMVDKESGEGVSHQNKLLNFHSDGQAKGNQREVVVTDEDFQINREGGGPIHRILERGP